MARDTISRSQKCLLSFKYSRLSNKIEYILFRKVVGSKRAELNNLSTYDEVGKASIQLMYCINCIVSEIMLF